MQKLGWIHRMGQILICWISLRRRSIFFPGLDFSLDEMKGFDLNSSPPPSDSEGQHFLKPRKSILQIRQERR